MSGTLPLNLVFVRHGESEGNVATNRDKKGDETAFSDTFKLRHNSAWRLTQVGIQQAIRTGTWLSDNFPPDYFSRQETSLFARALETAGHVGLSDCDWRLNDYLRERDRGIMDVISREERRELFHLPGGESIADLCQRVDRVTETLVRSASGKNVLLVCHGELMWAVRVRFERLRPDEFNRLDTSTDPTHHIHNCQILHYSRENPMTGEESPHFDWVRSICPWDQTLSSNEWQPIVRKGYTSAELIKLIEIMYPTQ